MNTTDKERIAEKLQRKFNFKRVEYARHPEKDQFFDDMAAEAIYQMERLGYTRQPKLEEELRISKVITAKLTDRCRELEAQIPPQTSSPMYLGEKGQWQTKSEPPQNQVEAVRQVLEKYKLFVMNLDHGTSPRCNQDDTLSEILSLINGENNDN